MGGFRLPGPLCSALNALDVDPGTMCRSTSAKPGPVDPESRPHHARPKSRPGASLDHEPRVIPDDKIEAVLAPEGSRLFIGGIWGHVERGQRWKASDGDRFVLSAASTDVIYYRSGRFYYQTSTGFIGEVTTYPFVEAGRRSAWLVTVAEVEFKLILGIVAGSSGVGFAIVVGSEIALFLVEHSADFAVWRRQLDAVLRARAMLRGNAPLLYEKLFDAALGRVIRDVKTQIPDAITPEVVAFLVGVILGGLGKKASRGALTALNVIALVMQSLVTRFVVSVVPGAVVLTKKQYEELARDIVEQLRAEGIDLSQADAERILEEVRRKPEVVRAAFEVLRTAFDVPQK